MNGKISMAGPGVNIVISAVSLIMFSICNGLSSSIFFLLTYMNAFLALFNLIPIPPLDGSKILAWNPVVFGVMLAMAGALLIVTFLL